MEARIRHVLFDFGDTLAREPFCVHAPPGVPDWQRLVLETHGEPGLLDRWHVGEATFAEFASRVAARTGLDPAAARAALEHDFRNLRLNERTLEFARGLGRARRAAIVTVNPEVFTQVIAPHYGLDRDFPVIVASWQERTADKTALCGIALERLGAPGGFSDALLVDNRADNVDAFRARGGKGWLFTGDEAFARDLPRLRQRLA